MENLSKEKQIEKERYEIAEIISDSFDHNGEKWEASDFEWSAFQVQQAGYRKQIEVIKEFVKRFEYHLRNATFTLGQTNDIQYALKKAVEEMKGGADE